jgi:hypothetical protein
MKILFNLPKNKILSKTRKSREIKVLILFLKICKKILFTSKVSTKMVYLENATLNLLLQIIDESYLFRLVSKIDESLVVLGDVLATLRNIIKAIKTRVILLIE